MRGAEAGGARCHRLSHDHDHAIDLLGRGLALLARLAHHVAAKRTMPDVEGRVDADLAAHRLDELREALEAVNRNAL